MHKTMTAHICLNSGDVVPVKIEYPRLFGLGFGACINALMETLSAGVPILFETGFTVSIRDYKWIWFDVKESM